MKTRKIILYFIQLCKKIIRKQTTMKNKKIAYIQIYSFIYIVLNIYHFDDKTILFTIFLS